MPDDNLDPDFLTEVRAEFVADNAVTLGAPMRGGMIHPEPLVRAPLAMLNRHGLIAGATGTGKTRTLQLVVEQLSQAGVPCFAADVKGDLSGLAVPGAPNHHIDERAEATGSAWKPRGFPVSFLSLKGTRGAQLRATISSFGPLLLSRVLGLNDTQTSIMTMVFAYCDDHKLALLDLADLRAVLSYLSSDQGEAELKHYGGMSPQSVAVILRTLIELERQGANQFFGEPEFDLDELLQVDDQGHGVISLLELGDSRDQPAMFSTFMMWMLGRLYLDLPEVGDTPKPKLMFFFDEAHLLFDGASKELRNEIERVVRLIRSKGVGIIFITQSPRDIPEEILGQLGNRIQHALRAFTADDRKALRSAARTFPSTKWYDIEELLTSVGTGEAIVTVLSPDGVPTPTVACHLIAPAASMDRIEDAKLDQLLQQSEQVSRYAESIDRDSAREILAERLQEAGQPQVSADPIGVEMPSSATRTAKQVAGPLEHLLDSRLARSMGNQLVRSAMGIIGRALRKL